MSHRIRATLAAAAAAAAFTVTPGIASADPLPPCSPEDCPGPPITGGIAVCDYSQIPVLEEQIRVQKRAIHNYDRWLRVERKQINRLRREVDVQRGIIKRLRAQLAHQH